MFRGMRCVVFTGAGGNEVVDVQERPDPVPGSGEVLVRVRYAGLNPADLHQRGGHYPAPPGAPADIPGLEVSGTVEVVGGQVLGFRPGDRVFGLVGGGGCADRVAVHERCVARVPDNLTELDAAAVPEAFITAHDAIRTRGRLTMGETLLVHGANGGVGTAAIQIGLVAGARVYGVVRSDGAAALVRELGAEPVRRRRLRRRGARRRHPGAGRGAPLPGQPEGAEPPRPRGRGRDRGRARAPRSSSGC